MGIRRIVQARAVLPFSPEGLQGIYESRLLIESEGVGSNRLQLVHATLKPGESPGGGAAAPLVARPTDPFHWVVRLFNL